MFREVRDKNGNQGGLGEFELFQHILLILDQMTGGITCE